MISIWSETLPESWHWSPNDNTPGGGKEFIVETARTLKKLGHEVVVYYDGNSREFEGVYYLPREFYEPSEIVIAQNSRPPKLGERNIYWTSLVTDREKDFLDFDKRIVLSKYHQGLFGNNSDIVPLGIHREQFDGSKKENICLYSSSPDGVWKLNDFPFEKYGYKFIQTYNGNYSEQEMVDLYNKARFWLHPGQRIELLCLSAIKAQQAGCIPVVVPLMALDETVKYGVKTNLEHYFGELEKALKNPPKVKEYRAKSWEETTQEIIKLF